MERTGKADENASMAPKLEDSPEGWPIQKGRLHALDQGLRGIQGEGNLSDSERREFRSESIADWIWISFG